MLSNDGYERFGTPGGFTLDLRLVPDPDPEATAPMASAGSWGQWRLWANGLNLTEHVLTIGKGEAVKQDCVTWYLAPLLRWLAGNWAPLLHEERLPSLVRGAQTARDAYLAMAATRMDDARVFGPWQAWAKRHSLRWASEGGMVPDVFLRRLGDDIEFSWGDRWQPGSEAANYVIDPGVAHCGVTEVATAINAALAWADGHASLKAHSWHQKFHRDVAARGRSNAADACLAWYLDGQEAAGQLVDRFRQAVTGLAGTAGDFLHYTFQTHALTRLAPAVAMFGALSPRISREAATELLAAAISCRRSAVTQHPIDEFVDNEPAWLAQKPWEHGYELALQLLDELDWDASNLPIDLEAILDRLGVARHDKHLGVDGPLGVALAGSEIGPAILVNSDHAQNRHGHGRRFTLAHELCHLLHDRDRARQVTHTSTPWAPVVVEQRANAFAAMLLMPQAAVRNALPQLGADVELADVQDMAQRLEVGLRAAIQHLANIGEITGDDRERLLDEAAPDSNYRS
jgi:Zn-dependent peptidase ImmA (M78 family)